MSAASAAMSLGFVLEQVQAIGQVAEIGQNQAHHWEALRWARRSYMLESQSVRLDALDHAKEEIKSHYDTYAGRIDTLLLVLALIFPFALNVIQFSDPFVPMGEADDCPDCIEVRFPLLVVTWSCLIGVVLVMPFWGILMLLRCKLKLDGWLEYSLAGLHHKLREIVSVSEPGRMHNAADAGQEAEVQETEQIVYGLVNMVLVYQEYLGRTWTAECAWLVHRSTELLWLSATSALFLSALSMWIWMWNKGGSHTVASFFFAAIIGGGTLTPVCYVARQAYRDDVPKPTAFIRQGVPLTRHESFPLAKGAAIPHGPTSRWVARSGEQLRATPQRAGLAGAALRALVGACVRRRAGRGSGAARAEAAEAPLLGASGAGPAPVRP